MTSSPDWKVLAVIAGAGFAVQLGSTLVGGVFGYSYFIDELYYVACARNLDFGYVDHPPIAPLLLRAVLAVFGDSVLAIRIPSAMAAALTVLLTGWLTARWGGGRFAQALSSLAVLVAPVFLVMFNFFSMNSLEILLWTSCLAILVVLVDRQDPRLWLAFGAVSGVALETKHTVALLAFGAVAGLLLTSRRRLLWSPWLLAGGALAFVLFLPNLLWQMDHDFPSLEFYRNATSLKNQPIPPLQVLKNQVLFMGPVTLPLWLAGLYVCLWKRPSHRFIAWAYLVLLSLLVLSASSRPDRIAGLYPVLFASGATFLEERLRSSGARVLAFAILALGGAFFAPMFLPILPPRTAAEFVAFLGLDTQIERGEGKRAELPQWLADRFGWEELADQVRAIYASLPEEERRGATILAPSYGQAGALELLGGEALPPVISPHNNYHLWGRERVSRLSRGIAISLDFDEEDLARIYGKVERVAVHDCNFCMSWRDLMPIYVAREPKLSPEQLAPLWEESRHFE
ncbi:MAG: glycosyltransferase family 39 protein [Vicinamibacteria bacterium]